MSERQTPPQEVQTVSPAEAWRKKAEASRKNREQRAGFFTRTKERMGRAGESIKSAWQTVKEKGGQAAEWLDDLPAKGYDILARADEWVDTKADNLAARIDGRVDAKVARLGKTGEKYRQHVKDALAELADAKRKAKSGVGLLKDSEFSSKDVLAGVASMEAAKLKLIIAEKIAQRFEKKSAEHKDKARAANFASSTLKRVRGLATFS